MDREPLSLLDWKRIVSTVVIEEEVRIPDWVRNLRSFRRWAHSEEFPDQGWISYLNGEVWVDMTKEQLFSHNQVKGEFATVLSGMVKTNRLGLFFPDGVLLSDTISGYSTGPDGIFVTKDSLQTERVRLIEGVQEGFAEIEGVPDMVLEVVSPKSVRKDKVVLRELYWQAGVPEYWLVDVRGQRLDFDILRRTAKSYSAVRKKGGWLKSFVFNKTFQLTREINEMGYPEYTLMVR
jgi:Uma2 family endonuclease